MQATPNSLGNFALQVYGLWQDSFEWLWPCLSFACATMLLLIIGNPLIAWLQNKRWKKGTTLRETWAVREDTPDTHQKKQGTPSMGGIGIIAVALATNIALWIFPWALGTFSGSPLMQFWRTWHFVGSLLLLPCVLLLHGALGFADDWSKASGRGGLRARAKFCFQCLLAFTFVAVLILLAKAQTPTGITYPFPELNEISVGVLPLLLVGFLVFVLLAMGNAVNLTDGIDGLAAGLAVQCGFFLILCGRGASDGGQISIVFWAALAGACFGFLFFNKHKARVFMGDTGSLAIGAALGAGAILQGAVFLLPFIGFIYFVEMFSVIVQVAWFKWTKKQSGEGKRLFRRAPLHHHFELGGWSEWRVVATFWAVNLFTSIIGLWLWKAGVLPHWP